MTAPGDPGAVSPPPASELGPGGSREAERLTFFSDAVMAIAITLLVIDLRLPETLDELATDADLRAALADLGQGFLSVGLSFMIIAVWWVGHDRLFRTLERIDGRLVLQNFVFLGAIAFLPFPTSLIGRYVDLPTAVALYAATNAIAGGALFAMRWHADRAGMIRVGSAVERRRRVVLAALAPIGFSLSIPLVFVNAASTALAWLLFLPAIVVIRLWFDRAERRVATEGDVERPAAAAEAAAGEGDAEPTAPPGAPS